MTRWKEKKVLGGINNYCCGRRRNRDYVAYKKTNEGYEASLGDHLRLAGLPE